MAALLIAAPAQAIPIEAFSALPSSTQAGGHPDVAFSFTVGNRQRAEPDPCACRDARNLGVHLPTGLIANPHATPQCDIASFGSDQCPVDSQVGVVEIKVSTLPGDPENPSDRAEFLAPVYILVPPPGDVGLLGFKATFNLPVFTVIGARTNSDYGVDATVENIVHFLPLLGVKQVLWGVPADPSHDALRFGLGQPVQTALSTPLCDANGNPSTFDPTTMVEYCSGLGPKGAIGELGFGGPGHPVSSSSPLTPFWQNPTTCGASLATSLDILGYDDSQTHADSLWPPTTDCGQLAFNPSLFAKPTTEQTDSPSGIDIDLKAPSFESPSAPSPSEIRGTRVTLPPGFTINPSAADGKTSCLDQEAKFGTTEEAQCPEFAKIGTLEVHSPVLPGVLPGAIYIGHPEAGNRYRLFITFDGFGVHVKLPGTVHPDPTTGQVVADFQELPQFPFEDFNLHFFGSERGVLATPTQCGTYPVTTDFTPWDGSLPDQTSTQFFTLGSGPNGSPCPNGPRPFAPVFNAASANNTAGAHTAFSLNLTRSDGDQNLSALNVTTPPGFSATLKGVPYCPQSAILSASALGYSGLAEQARPSCPPASQVGEAIAGAGAGTHPFYAPGKVYLAGPYKGAPLSLVVITPAVSGPYDLGDVIVRTALHVDPTSAQVTAVSDPLPQILEGVPLRVRSIMINLNRSNFALNPTNCQAFATEAKVFGNEGATASLSSHFQVANCAKLPFAPRVSLKLKGGTRRSANPSLRAVITEGVAGEANVKHASVALPHSEFLDQSHIQTICTRVQFAADHCPPASIYGFAKAETPLLAAPLEGPVYLRSSSNKLPDLVAALKGPPSQPIEIDLDGRIDTDKAGGIRTTFETVPDAEVSKFTLEMRGGAKGLLVNSTNLCKSTNRAVAKIEAQNGKTANQNPLVRNGCGGNGRHKRKTNKNRGAHR
ncbi:MAG: hypothetical protein H0X42_04255 [Solirubrobacterales bacterium]|nr:hypothetical protein [Solirubrobacterales bacterium]